MRTSRDSKLSRLFPIQIHPFCLYISIEIYSQCRARGFQAAMPIPSKGEHLFQQNSGHMPDRLNHQIHFISAYLSQSIFSPPTRYACSRTQRTQRENCHFCFIRASVVKSSGLIGILHNKSKVVYTLLILCFGSEIGNWKLEIGKIQRCRCVT